MSTNTLAALKAAYPRDGDFGPHNTENEALAKLAQMHRGPRIIRIKAADLRDEPNPCSGCMFDAGNDAPTIEQVAGCLSAPNCMEDGQRYVFVEDKG